MRKPVIHDYPRAWRLYSALMRADDRGPRVSEEKWRAARSRLFGAIFGKHQNKERDL